MLSEVYLGLGSNLGDRHANIAEATGLLRQVSTKLTLSKVYETRPRGFSGQPAFLNAACRLWTRLDPFELLRQLRQIEAKLGKRPAFANGPRTLDIDILLHGRTVLASPGLTIPHPRMAERDFVLAPLAEIAPNTLHAVLGQTILSLFRRLQKSEGKGTTGRLEAVYAPQRGPR